MSTSPTDTAPTLDTYLDEPDFDGAQDGSTSMLAHVHAFAGVPIPTAPRTLEQAIAWYAGQIKTRTKDWTNRCQEFSRTGPGCPGGAASALDAFFNCPREYRIVGGDVTDLEPGWHAVSRSNNSGSTMAKFGHIFPIVRDFADGRQGGISTDAIRRGWPDKINPTDLYNRWNHEYLGAVRWQNGMILDVKDPKPAKPVQDQKYERAADSLVDFERALRDLRAARDAAKIRGDWSDRDAFAELIRDGVDLKGRVRHAYETLRRVA